MPSVYKCVGHSTCDLPWQNTIDLSLFTEMAYFTTGQEFVYFQARNTKAAHQLLQLSHLHLYLLSLVDNWWNVVRTCVKLFICCFVVLGKNYANSQWVVRCIFIFLTPFFLHLSASLILSFSPSFLLQPSDPLFANQDKVYSDIGKEMLHHAFEGWVPCRCNLFIEFNVSCNRCSCSLLVFLFFMVLMFL